MDSINRFRQIIAYALHLAQTNPNLNRWAADPNAVRNDLASLIDDVKPDDDLDADSAWYAVASWLGEILATIPGGRLAGEELLPALDPDGSEFYRKLNGLLARDGDGAMDPETLDVIRVYSLCLDLDYQGYYSQPGLEHQRQAYRRRCRQVLEAATAPEQSETEATRNPLWRRLSGRAALWLLPVGGTILLYGIYRTLLKELYIAVVG